MEGYVHKEKQIAVSKLGGEKRGKERFIRENKQR